MKKNKSEVDAMVLSVIVPAYNADEFLLFCLKSIACQLTDDMELILINDGSVDNTRNIAESYLYTNKNVVVINQPNSGAGMARNTGLNVARGDYVAFVDADDWVAENTFTKLLKYVDSETADIVCCGYNEMGNGINSKHFVSDRIKRIDIDDECATKLYRDLFIRKMAGTEIWGKLFSRSIIEEHNIRFSDRKIVFAEDWLFTMKYFVHVKSTILLDEALIFHRIHPQSIMRSEKADYAKLLINACKEFADYLDCWDVLGVYNSVLPVLFRDLLLGSVHEKLVNMKPYREIAKELGFINDNKTVKAYFEKLKYVKSSSLEEVLANFLLSRGCFTVYAFLRKLWFMRFKILR